MQGCGQIRETKRQLFRANATLFQILVTQMES